MLEHYKGDARKLFNTSGMDYRALKIKDKLPGMTAGQAIELLSANGNLVKRPFILAIKGGMVGFRADELDRLIA
jgi:arsenate reductase